MAMDHREYIGAYLTTLIIVCVLITIGAIAITDIIVKGGC